MKLKTLIKDIPDLEVRGTKDIEITGVCANSKRVAPGNLFVAKKGLVYDGAKYIEEAIQGGISAVLTNRYDPTLNMVTQLIHADVESIEGALAAKFHGDPSDELLMIGVTGTNGKTTVSYLIKHILDSTDRMCGLLGTIEYIIGSHRYPASRTTPDVESSHKMLREMLNDGCQAAVMEVTSHALQQKRVQNIHFDIAVFTNLTQDHLDYHGTIDNYCAAKALLFHSLNTELKKKNGVTERVAVVNIDSPYGLKMVEGCHAHTMTYGIDGEADLKASNIRFLGTETLFDVMYRGKTLECKIPLVGRFNVYNALAALCVGIKSGRELELLVRIIAAAPPVPGRLELVPNSLGLNLYVDFAHTDDALKNVLRTLKETNKGKLITVFGCGGERDRGKRPKMAAACEEFSDICIVTSDNPRSEEPEEIIKEILAGFSRLDPVIIEVDRRDAIMRAIEMAEPGDSVLVAGKGHEKYQIFAHQTIEFDDAKVIQGACMNRESTRLATAGK